MPQYRNIVGEIKLLKQESDFIFPIEIWAYNDKLTLNGWRFTRLEEHREKWAGVPILVAYVNGGRTTGDGHNQVTRRDRNGEEYQSFTDADAERIVGATSDDESDIRVESEGDNKWLVAKATLFRWYARELTDKIVADAQQGRVMSVSIEALVTDSHMEGDVEVEDGYIPLGITVLGDGVAPAVPGAHVAMLNEMKDELKELKLRAASYLKNQNANKPHENHPTQKGMNKRMRLSKQQLRELQAKFGDYTVLAAEQSENGVVVCLLSKSGETAIYKMASVDESVVLDRVETINAQAHFCAEGCEDVLVDACDIVESAACENAELTARLASAEQELTEAKNTINAMRDVENRRRVQAAKDKAVATLNAFNLNREDKVEDKVLSAINADIESGVYTLSVDKDGNWIGDKAVEKEVKALCADAVMEADRLAAKGRKSVNIWDKLSTNSADDGSVGAFLASKGITD